MTENELKPCPFCGGRAVLRRGNKNKHGYFVLCTECNARSGFECDKYTSRQDNAQLAIEAWNRRKDNGDESRNNTCEV